MAGELVDDLWDDRKNILELVNTLWDKRDELLGVIAWVVIGSTGRRPGRRAVDVSAA